MQRKFACYHDAIKRILGDGKANKMTMSAIINHERFVIEREHLALKDFKKNLIREIRYLIKTLGKAYNSEQNKIVEEITGKGLPNYYYWFDYNTKEEALNNEGISKERYLARAIVFDFINENFREFFPPKIINSLKDDLYNSYIESFLPSKLSEKMKFIPSGIEVFPYDGLEERCPSDWNLAYKALEDELVIKAEYNSLHSTETETFYLSPQNVQYANHKVILLCYIHETGLVKPFEIVRLVNIMIAKDMEYKRINSSDIEHYYDFEAIVNVGVKNYFSSVVFGKQFKSKELPDGTWKVNAKVLIPLHFAKSKRGQPDPFALANFLQNFSDSLEVIKPQFLRDEMKRRADNMVKLYSHQHDSNPIINKSPHEQTGNVKMLEKLKNNRG